MEKHYLLYLIDGNGPYRQEFDTEEACDEFRTANPGYDFSPTPEPEPVLEPEPEDSRADPTDTSPAPTDTPREFIDFRQNPDAEYTPGTWTDPGFTPPVTKEENNDGA